MALGDKPVDLPRWANAPGRTLEPPESGTSTEMCKDNGYVQGKTPPARWDNWLINLIYQWTAYLDQFEQKAHTWIVNNLFTGGITVARADGSGHAVVSTGTGSGAGILATGGASGQGVNATGNGTAAGVAATGGSGGGVGVSGTGGSGTAAGVSGTGGGGGAPGVLGTGGSGGHGVQGVGGTNGHGGHFTADGAGTGVMAFGGASGDGIECVGGTGKVAAKIGVGDARFSTPGPANNADPGYDNFACGANQCKVWAFLEIEGGTTTITWDDNYNNATAAITGGGISITITFARALANGRYSLNITPDLGLNHRIQVNSRTTTQVVFSVYRWDPGTQNYILITFDGSQTDFMANVQIQGRQ